jgi:phage protein D
MNRDIVMFQPAATPTAKPFVLHYTLDANGNPAGDMTGLKLHHSKTLAKDIMVTVKSWGSKKGSGVTAIAKGFNAKAGAKGYGPPQKYIVTRPNLTQDAAQALASQKLAEFSRHERVIDVEMPGELTLTPQSLLQLDGTGTAFDQVYYPDEISRTMNVTGGFTQTVRAKNHSPQSETLPS